MNSLISFAVLFLVVATNIGLSTQQDTYDSHYDLKARDAAYLCTLMSEYLKTGRQPSLDKKPEHLEKSLYLKDDKCWKFKWEPCDAASYQHSQQRPCGWYQMTDADKTDCD